MAIVETYSSLEEKGEAFEQTIINNKKELDEKIELYKNNENKYLIFRGCNESHYMLYNKSQREWIKQDLSSHGIDYNEFVKKLIKNAKNGQGKLLENFYSAFGKPANDLIILGFLQHYGAPTTLLDWTYNFYNSLFFAIEDLTFKESKLEIDNYFSVYIINKKEITEKPENTIVDYIYSIIDSLNSMSKEGRNFSDDKELYEYMLEFVGNLNYDRLCSEFLAFISGYCNNGITHEINEYSFKLFYNQQNLNIINQEGLFIFNASMDKPLESYFRNEYIFTENSKLYNIPKISCLDIHKSLFEYTQKQLNDYLPFPVNKEFIYPKEEAIAIKAYQQFLNFDY